MKQLEKTSEFIAGVLNRSVRLVDKYFAAPQDYAKNRIGGQKKIIDSHMAIRIQLSMQDEPQTANQLKTEFGLTCHEKTVRTSLRDMGFRYKVIEQVIYLSVKHREERLKFADEHIIKMTIWFPYIFSDEKKWSLKGPHGPIKAWIREADPKMVIARK